MRFARFSVFFALLALFAVSPLFAQDLELTSDKMRYESESGDFWADGNVKVTRGTIWHVENRINQECILMSTPQRCNLVSIGKGNCTARGIALCYFDFI